METLKDNPPKPLEPHIGKRGRYYLKPLVVEVERLSGATVMVYGPWHEPFYVNQEDFEKVFTEL